MGTRYPMPAPIKPPVPVQLRLIGGLFTIGALLIGLVTVAAAPDTPTDPPPIAGGPESQQSTLSSTAPSDPEPVDTSPSPTLARVSNDDANSDGGTLDEPGPATSVSSGATSTPPTTTVSSVPASTKPGAPATTKPTTTTTAGQATSTTSAPSAGVQADAVVINPGENIQQAVNSHPAGTTFYLRAGVHRSPGGTRHVDPKTSNTFIGEPGAIMDGGGNTQFAFQDNMKASGVTIRGLIIQNYSTPQQRGAVDAGSDGWKAIGNEIRNNAGAGVAFGGNGWAIEGNHIHHNEQIGVKGQGSGGRVVNNTISHNNSNGRFDPSWEAGGSKFINTTNLYVAGNKVLDNRGPGLWTDGNNKGTIYEKNTVKDNFGPGIFHEISQSASIRNNTVTGNAHGFYVGGILVANSSDVTVTGNSVSGNDGGIIGLQDDRGSHNTINLVVMNNNVSFSTGVQGLIHNSGTDVTQSGTIFFDANVYTTTAAKAFRWGKTMLSAPEWQAVGQDPNGTFN
jgi:parallel beta-helix repeat protein